jgi:phosphoglucomutase
MDTHALSEAAFITAVEVFAAEGTDIMIQVGLGATPTPVISHAILTFNRDGKTDSPTAWSSLRHTHPPRTEGSNITPPRAVLRTRQPRKRIQDRANELLGSGKTRGIPIERALKVATTHVHDYIVPYVRDLRTVVDLDAIATRGYIWA